VPCCANVLGFRHNRPCCQEDLSRLWPQKIPTPRRRTVFRQAEAGGMLLAQGLSALQQQQAHLQQQQDGVGRCRTVDADTLVATGSWVGPVPVSYQEQLEHIRMTLGACLGSVYCFLDETEYQSCDVPKPWLPKLACLLRNGHSRLPQISSRHVLQCKVAAQAAGPAHSTGLSQCKPPLFLPDITCCKRCES
jgi:hypothetical protein